MESGSDMLAHWGHSSTAPLYARICKHTGFLIHLSHPQGLIINTRCFLMTMTIAKQRCLSSSPHTHTHQLPLLLSQRRLPSFPLLSAHQINLQLPPVSCPWSPNPRWHLPGSSPPPRPSEGQGPGPGAGPMRNRLMLFSRKWGGRGVGSVGQAYLLTSTEA